MGGMLSGYGQYQQGKAQQAAYNRNAETLRAQAATNLAIAGDEMASMRTQQSRDQATARAARGASGVTSEGSGAISELAIAERWNSQINDAMLSASQQDINTKHQASMQEYQGALAKAQGKAAFTSGIVSDVAGAGLSFGLGGVAGKMAGTSSGFNVGQAAMSSVSSLFKF